ncbi:hypothetical protein ANCDUO_13307 [Ancylostoma duodenale]|uniref:Uncharacterized protein n=1 Tax=Ancylostoma duodenale TaxID=51022 RepID=A0A0C2D379_9BILA|nr:hypothetical protein ANCDUO_13307 [Ancylostoma duodenale]
MALNGGVTGYDRVFNEDIRQQFAILPLGDKLRQLRLRWQATQGRMKQRWIDKLHDDVKLAAIRPDHEQHQIASTDKQCPPPPPSPNGANAQQEKQENRPKLWCG